MILGILSGVLGTIFYSWLSKKFSAKGKVIAIVVLLLPISVGMYGAHVGLKTMTDSLPNTIDGLAPGDHVVKLKGVSSTTSKEKEISFTLTVNPPAQNNGGSGGSSGGGSSGGGSSGGIRNVLAVCEDKKDNDNDGLIDYPLDLGCSSKKDSSETDPTEVEQTDTTPSDNDGQTLGGQEKDIEIRVVFWLY
jgi:hypothetical protein